MKYCRKERGNTRKGVNIIHNSCLAAKKKKKKKVLENSYAFFAVWKHLALLVPFCSHMPFGFG